MTLYLNLGNFVEHGLTTSPSLLGFVELVSIVAWVILLLLVL